MQAFKPTPKVHLAEVAIAASAVLVLANAALYFLGAGEWIFWADAAILAIAAAAALAAVAAASVISIELDDKEIRMTTGVLSKTRVIIPLDKIDNITEKQNLLEGLLGVADLYLDTPATESYEMVLRDLQMSDSRAILKSIGNAVRKDDDKG